VLQLVWDDAAEAIKSGLFDEREDRHLSRSVLVVDEQGWEELHDVLAETLDRAMQIQADSAARNSKDDNGSVNVNLVMMTHPTPKSAKNSTAPASGTTKKRRSPAKKKAGAKA
jgi:hypothetical protein